MTPDAVKDWLKTNGRDRKWLAAELGVSIHTLNNQFTAGRFSKPVEAHLARLMAIDPAALLMTADEWREIERARVAANYPHFAAFARAALRAFTRAILRDTATARAAEDSPTYNDKEK